MASHRLTRRAERDLKRVLTYTRDPFGTNQTQAYAAGFERMFGLLAEFPRIGIPADDLKPRYRLFRFEAHYIFYTEETDYILIRAIIHTSQNLRRALFR